MLLTRVTKPRFVDGSTILFGVMEGSQKLWNATVATESIHRTALDVLRSALNLS